MGASDVISLIITYGPTAVTMIQTLVNKLESGGTLTVADVQAEFVNLKPYDGYHIKLASQAST